MITKVNQIKETSKQAVVLTFDDGPGKYLPEILTILQRYDIQATFFWQSRFLYKKRPWRRTVEEGHTIGSHTINHPNLLKLTYDEQYRQIHKSKQYIEAITSQDVELFRPPFGAYNECTIKITKELHLLPVLWSISSFDWSLKHNPIEIVNNVVDNLHDDGIILLHELEQTVKILPELIEGIQAKGFQFTNLSRSNWR
ncbi:polysaccharide deacetylase family protein [Bacillus salitolerans]|uniref:Polysaccharide deacetylase family protein n=1 Tax=Bacillus salitolerans TaxID=1437434 RepID=A0ABW4LVT6_9BACI